MLPANHPLKSYIDMQDELFKLRHERQMKQHSRRLERQMQEKERCIAENLVSLTVVVEDGKVDEVVHQWMKMAKGKNSRLVDLIQEAVIKDQEDGRAKIEWEKIPYYQGDAARFTHIESVERVSAIGYDDDDWLKFTWRKGKEPVWI
ncbi:hypothetical protein [uncultured Adlercreutzia sp.]|uniref:hypothetical protein n=1 Tax=uncultured Adlercreutzia sp. TaxID=875803 RepID=UPI0025D2B1CF|nr:hypothetical protein [uncultured Adlercreutzia sp.]